ncbi:MAG: glycerophosphodiester phosphodiesterase [Candidatus Kariarchaeaceae archaeon]|jgi:glycerophosphoryl diester phosphodiesterase
MEEVSVPLIIAHRGYTSQGNFHHSSLQSFGLAIDLGADGLECDVRITKDNQLIIYHDPIIFRKGKFRFIHNLEYSELVNLVGNGSLVPRLMDLLKIVPEHLKLFIEIKDYHRINLIAQELEKLDVNRPNVWLMEGIFVNFRIIHFLSQLGFQMGKHILFLNKWNVNRINRYQVKLISPSFIFLRSSLIQHYSKKGFKIMPWSVNHPTTMHYLLRKKIWALYTDQLEKAMKVKKQILLHQSLEK